MAQYLLKASEQEMLRWKAAAKREGISFAEYIRAALEAYIPGENVYTGLPPITQKMVRDRLAKQKPRTEAKGPSDASEPESLVGFGESVKGKLGG